MPQDNEQDDSHKIILQDEDEKPQPEISLEGDGAKAGVGLLGFLVDVRQLVHVPTKIKLLVRDVVDGVAPAGYGRYAVPVQLSMRSPDGKQVMQIERPVELPLSPSASPLEAVAYIQQHRDDIARQAQQEQQAEMNAHRRKIMVAQSMSGGPFRNPNGRA